jgi:phenylpyruvate tautomerase PptA (4-oxalocrotonate tautomerase family)
MIFNGGRSMPFIKVHISSLEAPANKALLVKRLREIMVEELQINEKIGQVVLYEAKPQHRSIHTDRSDRFVFMEVYMYPGRTAEVKKMLMESFVEEVHQIFHVDPRDINCCLLEIPQDNWFGGININK